MISRLVVGITGCHRAPATWQIFSGNSPAQQGFCSYPELILPIKRYRPDLHRALASRRRVDVRVCGFERRRPLRGSADCRDTFVVRGVKAAASHGGRDEHGCDCRPRTHLLQGLGHGQPVLRLRPLEPAVDRQRMDTYADDLAHLMDAFDLTEVILVGIPPAAGRRPATSAATEAPELPKPCCSGSGLRDRSPPTISAVVDLLRRFFHRPGSSSFTAVAGYPSFTGSFPRAVTFSR